MEDDIDVLLTQLSEQRLSIVNSEYSTRLRQEEAAWEALSRTLTEQQRKLFLAYEEAQSACACLSEDAYARQAFLLAREIYR